MSLSFWLSVIVCVVALLEAWIGHREGLDNLKTVTEKKEKRWHRFKLLVCWLVFVLAFINILASAWESITSNEASRKQAEAMANATNEIARLNSKVQSKPLAYRVRILLNKIDPRILLALRAGATHGKVQIDIVKLTELQELCNESGSQKYITFKKLGGRPLMIDGTIATEVELSLTMNLIEPWMR